MNLKEGTRRLALFLGALGAAAAGFASYSVVQNIQEQVAHHQKFEQLATSPAAQQALRSVQSTCIRDPSNKQYGDEKYVPMAEVNGSGIKRIYWSKDYHAEWIQTDDGDNLFSASSQPPAWEYSLVVIFPVVGFLIPWVTVRAFAWVGAGFVKPDINQKV